MTEVRVFWPSVGVVVVDLSELSGYRKVAPFMGTGRPSELKRLTARLDCHAEGEESAECRFRGGGAHDPYQVTVTIMADHNDPDTVREIEAVTGGFTVAAEAL